MRRWLPALCLVVAGCSSGTHDYPVNVQTNFLNSCESSGGDSGRCQCALTWLERHVSLTRFKADEDDARAGSAADDLRRAIAAC